MIHEYRSYEAVPGSHSVYLSQPQAVTELIKRAAADLA
jgi:hypothetical protein